MIFADTHVLAWLASGNKRIPAQARNALFEGGFVVSAVTAWEYEELHLRGRFPVHAPLRQILDAFASTVVDFPADGWTIATSLPTIHRDPVDRMLLAHAMIADAILATADRDMRRYPVPTLW